jgi:hypothetical protein
MNAGERDVCVLDHRSCFLSLGFFIGVIRQWVALGIRPNAKAPAPPVRKLRRFMDVPKEDVSAS